VIGIVVAAGRGARMRHLTARTPKCLLHVAGKALLDHALTGLRDAGCSRLIVITGYEHRQIATHVSDWPDVACIWNERASTTNVLRSLMCARAAFSGPALIVYGDVLLSPRVFHALLATDGDIVIGVDIAWRASYAERDEHPVSQAEKVHMRPHGHVLRLGKHLVDVSSPDYEVGEFVGAMRVTARGGRILAASYDALDARLKHDSPFQAAERWSQAYLTDLLQECVDNGERVAAARVTRGWREVDTPQDYERIRACASPEELDAYVPGTSDA
jgi:choline kinase